MDHYVVYHNVESMGRDCLGGGFSIVTSKNMTRVIGNRIWLVRGKGNKRRYHLVETFVAERFCATVDDGRFLYYAEADKGEHFGLKFPIGGLAWFQDLMKATGNFGLGLQGIKSPAVINGLYAVSRIRD